MKLAVYIKQKDTTDIKMTMCHTLIKGLSMVLLVFSGTQLRLKKEPRVKEFYLPTNKCPPTNSREKKREREKK